MFLHKRFELFFCRRWCRQPVNLSVALGAVGALSRIVAAMRFVLRLLLGNRLDTSCSRKWKNLLLQLRILDNFELSELNSSIEVNGESVLARSALHCAKFKAKFRQIIIKPHSLPAMTANSSVQSSSRTFLFSDISNKALYKPPNSLMSSP